MDVTPLVPTGAQIIQSYADGMFRISGVTHDGAVLVYPNHTVSWSVSAPLCFEDFAPLFDQAGDFDVVLLGLGADVSAPPFELRKQLKARGINIDFMDTGAACRTYNVLMADGRRVVAALLPV